MDTFEIVFRDNPIYLGSFAQCKYISIRDINNTIIPIISIDESLGVITIALDTGVSVGDKLLVSSRNIGCFPSIDDGGELPILRSQLTDIYNENINFSYNNLVPESSSSPQINDHRLPLNNKMYRFVNYIYHVFKEGESREDIRSHLLELGTFARASKPLTMASGSKSISIIVWKAHYNNLVLISGDNVISDTSTPIEVRGSLISSFDTDVNIANVMVEVTE